MCVCSLVSRHPDYTIRTSAHKDVYSPQPNFLPATSVDWGQRSSVRTVVHSVDSPTPTTVSDVQTATTTIQHTLREWATILLMLLILMVTLVNWTSSLWSALRPVTMSASLEILEMTQRESGSSLTVWQTEFVSMTAYQTASLPSVYGLL